ncbi:MAG: DUF1501 domain-containing protein [Verrucomicrobia bacterium]|nr:DUF1501 domain-containing protein [Verrucomicrobiota bacterium]
MNAPFSNVLPTRLPQTQMPRRAALKVGGMGLFGLTIPKLLRAAEASSTTGPRAKVKSIIFLFQWGGPSSIDMFDRKPDAPEGVRGPLKSISSSLPGVPVCEGLERTAKILKECALIRTLHHTMSNHNSAGYYALTGHAPPSDDQRLRDSLDLYPAYGSVIDRLAPANAELPTFVAYPHVISDGSITPGQHASFLGKAHDPLLFQQDPNLPGFGLPEFSLPAGVSLERLEHRREMQQLIDRQARLMDHAAAARGLDAYYDRALAMLHSPKLRKAFDLASEPAVVREAYGRTTYGQSCLLARRLAEAGAKFISVYFSDNIGGQSTESGGWDTHGFNNTRMYPIVQKYHLPITDQTLPTLINDLKDRGMLDTTLVVWVGEFGRTPKINGNASRDHWPHCYTALLAGAGVKRGFVYGASDKQGAYPEENGVRPDDLAATLYHLMGIAPQTEVRDRADRPLPISRGNVIEGVLA